MNLRLILYILVALLGVAAIFFPLTGGLGYESAATFGLVVGILSIFATIFDRDEPAYAPPSPATMLATQLFRNLLIPLIVLVVASLFTLNCDPATGFAFWLLIPMVSLLVGTVTGVAAKNLFERRWTQVLFGIAVVIFSILDLVLRLILEPPIVGFNLFIGYFAGSLYDEALTISTSLVYYRFMNLLLLATVMALLQLKWNIQHYRSYRANVAISLILMLFTAVAYSFRQKAGIDLDHDTIAKSLGGVVESEHFVIHYPATATFDHDTVLQLVEDHEFRYAQLRRFFKHDIVASEGTKINSYIYESEDQKEALTGGRSTMVAKIWLGEFHLIWSGMGDDILTHEMAHVFTREFAAGPLMLSTRWGVGINMGIVEGTAMAAQWSARHLTPHQSAAAFMRLGKVPSMESLIGAAGFWTQSSALAYQMVGSFFRYLIDRYGIEKLKIAYPHGDFEGGYGKPLSELIAEWQKFLNGVKLSKDEMAIARTYFSRRSIFVKVCPRKIGALEVEASGLSSRKEWQQAIKKYNEILNLDPYNTDYKINYLKLMQLTGVSLQESQNQMSKLAQQFTTERRGSGKESSLFTPLQESKVLSMLGDGEWALQDRAGQTGSTESKGGKTPVLWYRKALENGVTNEMRRGLEIKIGVYEGDSKLGKESLFRYLVKPDRGNFADYDLVRWGTEEEKNPYAMYLIGRRFFLSKRWLEAEAKFLRLIKSQSFQELSTTVQDETRLLYAISAFTVRLVQATQLKTDIDATAHQELQKLKESERSYYREAAKEWLERYKFEEKRMRKE